MIYVANVKIAVVAKNDAEVYDTISSALTENLILNNAILDWSYDENNKINNIGKYDKDDYEESDAF